MEKNNLPAGPSDAAQLKNMQMTFPRSINLKNKKEKSLKLPISNL